MSSFMHTILRLLQQSWQISYVVSSEVRWTVVIGTRGGRIIMVFVGNYRTQDIGPVGLCGLVCISIPAT